MPDFLTKNQGATTSFQPLTGTARAYAQTLPEWNGFSLSTNDPAALTKTLNRQGFSVTDKDPYD